MTYYIPFMLAVMAIAITFAAWAVVDNIVLHAPHGAEQPDEEALMNEIENGPCPLIVTQNNAPLPNPEYWLEGLSVWVRFGRLPSINSGYPSVGYRYPSGAETRRLRRAIDRRRKSRN